ncbi:MAG: 4-(cytidine 5'-diphospho)-2-C-methyl-D-erythritol kinase [Burkholderiales bacterium]|jgi:4-diphosphocytidyl-2-C-methyl-D-erythritol kinase|nr:4-(cytidine 5'-diphospho)-2-C-methyl-D-erythritol kinase [Betaproteobacteria bacterium]
MAGPLILGPNSVQLPPAVHGVTGERHSLPAPAKLNLFLHVTGRREDGYHELQTLFRLLDFGDTVHLTVREDGAIVREDPLPGVDAEQDLTVRAARALQAASACRLGAHIELSKRLPMGGGLGGGSSDAATVLLGLNRLWGLDWPRERLLELALPLGADVPVFVFGRNAWAEGVGERLQAVDLPPAWYVVLTPPRGVSTAAVFAAPELTRNHAPITIRAFFEGQAGNDLQAVAAGLEPDVAEHLEWLSQFGRPLMSGSGSSVFVELASASDAERVLQLARPQRTGFVAQGLDLHPLHGWAA